MTLRNIELTEEQQKELKEKLDAWKLSERKKIEAALTEKYEQMEAELREETEDTIEEIKENMKKVYTKRFMNAIKEMYEEIRAQVVVESMHSPEQKAFESVKSAVYPFINESTANRHKDEFNKLVEMYESAVEELELLKGKVKKAKLMESLSPEVRKVVDKLLGEGREEEIVEKFASIKAALKEEVTHKGEELKEELETSQTLNEDMEEDEEDEEEYIQRDIEEEVVEEDNETNDEFQNFLNEQLTLAGLKKAR